MPVPPAPAAEALPPTAEPPPAEFDTEAVAPDQEFATESDAPSESDRPISVPADSNAAQQRRYLERMSRVQQMPPDFVEVRRAK